MKLPNDTAHPFRKMLVVPVSLHFFFLKLNPEGKKL